MIKREDKAASPSVEQAISEDQTLKRKTFGLPIDRSTEDALKWLSNNARGADVRARAAKALENLDISEEQDDGTDPVIRNKKIIIKKKRQAAVPGKPIKNDEKERNSAKAKMKYDKGNIT